MKAIGKTTSGKEVFDVARPSAYKGWSPQDHKEAAELHLKEGLKLSLGSPEENFQDKLRAAHGKIYLESLKNKGKDADWKNEFRKDGVR